MTTKKNNTNIHVRRNVFKHWFLCAARDAAAWALVQPARLSGHVGGLIKPSLTNGGGRERERRDGKGN